MASSYTKNDWCHYNLYSSCVKQDNYSTTSYIVGKIKSDNANKVLKCLAPSMCSKNVSLLLVEIKAWADQHCCERIVITVLFVVVNNWKQTEWTIGRVIIE